MLFHPPLFQQQQPFKIPSMDSMQAGYAQVPALPGTQQTSGGVLIHCVQFVLHLPQPIPYSTWARSAEGLAVSHINQCVNLSAALNSSLVTTPHLLEQGFQPGVLPRLF